MRENDIRDWIYQEFEPLKLAVTTNVIDQQAKNAVRYWNTHSAYKYTAMFDYTSGSNFVQLNASIKNVVSVYPSVLIEELFSNHPMWVLLGFITLDRFTTDLIMLSHAFEGYRVYLGNDFRWTYQRSQDPDNSGGKLYVKNVPRDATKLAVVGLKRIIPNEDITDEFIIDWILYYTKALVKIQEGNILRKFSVIRSENDGESLVKEGLEEQKELQERLRKDSRWALLASRG